MSEAPSFISGLLPSAVKRPIAAATIITAAVLLGAELTGCDSSSDQSAAATAVSTTYGPSVQETIPTQPNQPAQPASIWAGYVALAPKDTQYTSVHGEFTVPSIICRQDDQEAGTEAISQWVGLDGWGNKTVEQIGINATCVDKNAPTKGDKGQAQYNGPHDYVPTYYAWWMNYGGGDYSAVLKFPIHPGDRVDASVTHAEGDEFDMRLDNKTTRKTYEKSTTCHVENGGGSCQRAMADWIIERTGNSALGEFGTATFTHATASTSNSPKNQRSVADLRGFPVNMIQQDQLLAATSGLSPDGQSFNVLYEQHGHAGE